MKYTGKEIDTSMYKEIDIFSRERGIYEYSAKNPINEESRDNHNSFFLKRTVWGECTHIGEVLGSIIAKKIGLRVCDAELYKRPLLKKNVFDWGAISYVNKSKYDVLLNPILIIQEYLKNKGEKTIETPFCDIDTILDSVFFKMNSKRRPYQEFLEFKQDFISMLVFDLKFLNADRDLSNWLMRADKRSGQIDLYPMFDNAAIVGFDYEMEDIRGKSIENMDKEHTSGILIPELFRERNSSDYKEMLKYILKKYPVQTKNALEKVKTFTVKDLEEVLNEIEGVTQERKELAIELFKKREIEIDKIYMQYKTNSKEYSV